MSDNGSDSQSGAAAPMAEAAPQGGRRKTECEPDAAPLPAPLLLLELLELLELELELLELELPPPALAELAPGPLAAAAAPSPVVVDGVQLQSTPVVKLGAPRLPSTADRRAHATSRASRAGW